MVYGHANGTTIEDTINVALDYQAQGYKAIRLQCGVPGMASTYGVSKDKYFYEPADADLPTENVWNTSKYLRVVPELFKAAREALGWDVHLLHDIHHRLTPSRRAVWARIWNPIAPSGWKTRRLRKIRRPSA
jgi:mannonate dehydratase